MREIKLNEKEKNHNFHKRYILCSNRRQRFALAAIWRLNNRLFYIYLYKHVIRSEIRVDNRNVYKKETHTCTANAQWKGEGKERRKRVK